MNDFEERMLRLNGKKPTVRDRWTAFYRLYRIAKKVDECHSLMGGTIDALRVLGFSRYIVLCNSSEQSVGGRATWPTFLRRRFIDLDRRRRIYANGDYDQLVQLDKRVAAEMRKEGVEMTPTQTGDVRATICQKVRALAQEKDVRVPDDDMELLRWLKGRVTG